MSISPPKFQTAGTYDGKSPVDPWLSRLASDFQQYDPKPPPAFYFEAINTLFIEDAATWLANTPRIHQIINARNSATTAEVREFQKAVKKQFPASVSKRDHREKGKEYVEAGEAQKLTLEEALSKKRLKQRHLSALTGEERIEILRHIGTELIPDDEYSLLPSVAENWDPKKSILEHSDETFIFPVIDTNALFIRKCYHELYDIITKLPITKARLRILLTGTPGIGKSTFLIYFIIRYLYESTRAPNARKRDILIFQPAESDDEFYAFAGPNIVRMGTYTDFRPFFLLSTTWYLVDWKPISRPKSTRAATLFALSPNSVQDDDFKVFEKVLSDNLCMPVWTYDELEECRGHIFPELSKNSLNYLYDRLGGIPRYCLQAPTEALRNKFSEKKALKKGLRRLRAAFKGLDNPLGVLRAQEESSTSVKVSGRLLHKVPDPDYQDGGASRWASAYVIDRFVKIMDSRSADNMKSRVMEGIARNERDGALGKVFECYVRHLFFKGGGDPLKKRRLYEASDERKELESQRKFTIPEGLDHKPFSGMVDFSIPKGDTGTIWTPGPNFPSVDIILTPNLLFQITISQHHPIKQEPLKKILEKLSTKKKVLLYFVVPENIFENFPIQSYLTEQGTVSKQVPKPIGKLEQWVIGVPLGVDVSNDAGTRKRPASEDDTPQPQTPKKKKKKNNK